MFRISTVSEPGWTSSQWRFWQIFVTWVHIYWLSCSFFLPLFHYVLRLPFFLFFFWFWIFAWGCYIFIFVTFWYFFFSWRTVIVTQGIWTWIFDPILFLFLSDCLLDLIENSSFCNLFHLLFHYILLTMIGLVHLIVVISLFSDEIKHSLPCRPIHPIL